MEVNPLSCWHEGVFYAEEFVPIIGYEGVYEVSNFGRIKSMQRMVSYVRHGKPYTSIRRERILNVVVLSGYEHVILQISGHKRNITVHRLVAIHFIPNPENKPQVNHKRGEKRDNRFFMLEWATPLENNQHAFDTGLKIMPKGALAKKSIPISQFTKDGVWIRDWGAIMDVQREMGFHQSTIAACVRGIGKTAHGFVWKFKLP